MKKLILLFQGSVIISVGLISCQDKKEVSSQKETASAENEEEMAYRPNFHFTPKSGWMNDPKRN